MNAREVLFSRPAKASGALKKVPVERVVLSRAAQRVFPRARPNFPSGLSFRIIHIPQVTRIVRVFTRGRFIAANIKVWIIAWERRSERRMP